MLCLKKKYKSQLLIWFKQEFINLYWWKYMLGALFCKLVKSLGLFIKTIHLSKVCRIRLLKIKSISRTFININTDETLPTNAWLNCVHTTAFVQYLLSWSIFELQLLLNERDSEYLFTSWNKTTENEIKKCEEQFWDCDILIAFYPVL